MSGTRKRVSTYRVRIGLRMLKVWQEQSWRKDTDARNGLGEGQLNSELAFSW